MKVIVDIPEEAMEAVKNGSANIYDMCGYLMNGKTLKPCEDAISRQAVMDALCNDCELFRNGEQTCFTKCEEYHFLATLPSVTPQPKTGHWIFCEGIKGKDNVEKCSCCQSHWREAVVYTSDTQEYLRLRLNYCPNCGKKMIEPQESER